MILKKIQNLFWNYPDVLTKFITHFENTTQEVNMGKKYIGIDPSTKTGVVILSEDGSVIEAKEITTKVKKTRNGLWI